MRLFSVTLPVLAVLVAQAFSVTVKYPHVKLYNENPYQKEDYNAPPETYIPDDVPVKYGNKDAYAKDDTYYPPPPPPPPYNDYVEDVPYPYVNKDKYADVEEVPYPYVNKDKYADVKDVPYSYGNKDKYADNYKTNEPFITISANDPELRNHEYVSASQFTEGRCRREVPVDNLNATWYWSDIQAFLAAGSLSMQLTTRQIWMNEAQIPRHRLQFSVIPYPSQGVLWWTLLDDVGLNQKSQDIDQSTQADYTNYPTDSTNHKHLATRFIEKEHITVVLTDNKYFALLVRCLNDEYRDYMVMSMEPTLRLSHLELIRNKITELGFNPSYFRVSPDYEHHHE